MSRTKKTGIHNIHNDTNKDTETMQATRQFDLTTRAMLVRISISVWSARRFDRTASEDVTRLSGADKDAGRFTKHLLGGKRTANKYAAAISSATQLRSLAYQMTLPWTDEGWRLLPMSNYTEFVDAMRRAKQEFDDAVAEFIADYPQLKLDAKQHLGTMYQEADYPSEAELKLKFAARISYSPIPDAGDLRVALPPEQIREIEVEIEDRVHVATTAAMQDCWGRLHEVVKRVAERLGDPEAIFRDSLIGNVRELTDVLARLNITDDERLEDMRLEVAAKLATLDPEALRENPKERKAATKNAQEILKDITSIMGGAL